MGNFKDRINKALILQEEVIKFLDDNKIEYILSGYEYLKNTLNARNLITNNNDKTSLFIRHYPDISLIYKNKSCLLEIKNSSGIEKYCYENYLSLSNDLDIAVFLYLKNHKICDIKDLKFTPMSIIDPIAKIEIPIIDGVWKNPRSMSDDNYYLYISAYKARKKYTSGCTFAFIDFNNTYFYDRNVLIPKTI